MTIHEIAELLVEEQIHFKIDEEKSTCFVTCSGLDNYHNKEGEKRLLIAVNLHEEGKYLNIYAPFAFKVPKDKAAVFNTACGIIQWNTKLVQFEYDKRDGEVRPVIEFPLEDGVVTGKQLKRCIDGMASILDQYYLALKTVIDTGEIKSLDNEEINNGQLERIQRILGKLPPEMLQELINRMKGRD